MDRGIKYPKNNYSERSEVHNRNVLDMNVTWRLVDTSNLLISAFVFSAPLTHCLEVEELPAACNGVAGTLQIKSLVRVMHL